MNHFLPKLTFHLLVYVYKPHFDQLKVLLSLLQEALTLTCMLFLLCDSFLLVAREKHLRHILELGPAVEDVLLSLNRLQLFKLVVYALRFFVPSLGR